MYKAENAKLQEVVDKLVAEGACEHDIKKQVLPTWVRRVAHPFFPLLAERGSR